MDTPGFFPHVTAPAMRVLPADSNHFGTNRLPVGLIVMHATAGTDSAAWLSTTSPVPHQVSTHVLVRRDGVIIRLVPDNMVAFHAGPAVIGSNTLPSRTNPNRFSLGIELENTNTGKQNYPLAQIASAANMVAWWYNLYGVLPILAHHAIQTDKTDPFVFPWDTFYKVLASILIA